MGELTEATFERAVAACPACRSLALEIHSIVDRTWPVMLGEATTAGRWGYDGEKFIDGTYRIACTACAHVVFESSVCPRCNAADALPAALSTKSRLTVPRRCPSCDDTELLVHALLPARALASGGRAAPATPLVEFGEPGCHVVAFACEACDAATVTQTCPVCDAPGPLRPRP